MKGISPIIATILMVMIVIGLVAFSYSWFMSIGSGGKEATITTISQMEKLRQNIEIGTAYQCGSDICFELRASTMNTIPIPINGTSYYINDEPKKVAAWNAELGYKSCLVGEPEGLVLSLHFDEGSGTIAKDDSGKENDGDLLDANTTNADGNTPPQWVDGKFGKALKFDGVDDYVNVSNSNAEVFNATHPFTVCAWFYPISDPILEGHHYCIVSEWQITFSYKIYNSTHTYLTLEGSWDNVGWNGARYVLSSPLPEKWYFMCGKYDGNNLYLYLNRELKAQLNDVGNNMRIPRDIHVGSWKYPQPNVFFGIIDEVRIYNRALTEQEIRNLHNLKLSPGDNCYGKILNYKCKIGDKLKIQIPWGASKEVPISGCSS